MQVNFKTTAADYRAFYTYFYLRRYLGWRILIIAVCGALIGGLGESSQSFEWGTFLLRAFIAITFFALLYVGRYALAIHRLNKRTRAAGFTEISLTITPYKDGFEVLSPSGEPKFWRWESIRTADSGGGYVFILLFHEAIYVIPRHFFQSDNEADNFTGVIRNGIIMVRGDLETSRKRRAMRLRWWGLLGLVPNIGVIAGLILFFRGIFQFRDRWLIVIGVADVLFTVLFWSLMMRWERNSPTFANLWTQQSQFDLNRLFRDVEFYKIEHGAYPDSLSQLVVSDKSISIDDPLQYRRPQEKSIHFFYEKVGDKYWLFSVGPDGEPFTKDDLFPALQPADTAKFGLLLRR